MADKSDSSDLPPSLNDDVRQGVADLSKQKMAETDRKYFKFKMKQIKKAKQNGNHGKAERLGVELAQYFGVV